MRHRAKFQAGHFNRCRDGHLSIFQDGGRPPYWICYRHIWTIHEVYLVVSIAEQNLVGIDAIVLTMWPF